MYNPMDLSGKRILVTGASSGIGRCCAQVLSRLGARLVIVGRDMDRLQITLSSLNGEGHQAEVFDLREIDDIPSWLKGLATISCGEFEGLVHSAGVQMTLPIQTVKLSDYRELMSVNVDAAYALAKGFRQRGVHRAPASLVFISSITALTGEPGLSAYCTSKAALLGLTKSLAMEFSRNGIRVNSVCPGHVATEMAEDLGNRINPEQLEAIAKLHPLGIGRPEDVAHAVSYLLADTGRWVTGSNLVVDGGYTAH